MTREQVEQLAQGPEIDKAVAVAVFGLPERTLDDPCPNCGSEMRNCGVRAKCFVCDDWIHSPYREYSTEIAVAWAVVRDIRSRKLSFSLSSDSQGGWTAWVDGRPAAGPTEELAICRAALLATQASR